MPQTAVSNVIIFKNNSVFESINSFLKEMITNYQDNTESNYKSHFRRFFEDVIHKQLEELTWNDIKSITTKACKSYRDYLLFDKKVARTTINARFSALTSLYKHFNSENNEINFHVLADVKPLKVLTKDTEKRSWGSLSEEEIEQLYKFCDNEKKQALEKRLFFELSIVTGLRQDALLNLTFSDIKKQKSSSGTFVWTISFNQKRNEGEKPITDNLYERLLQIKRPNSDYVFKICDVTLRETLSKFCISVGIDQEQRRIRLHSLKKTSVNIVFENTKDIVVTAQHACHKDITTTHRRYIEKQKDYTSMPSYYMFENGIDVEIIDAATHEELLQAIKKMPKNVQKEIAKLLLK